MNLIQETTVVDPQRSPSEEVSHADTLASIDAKLRQSVVAFAAYRRTSMAERSRCLRRAADILEQDVERWARLMTLEMGKTLVSARAEALKCATVCRYYAEHGAAMLEEEALPAGATRSVVRYEPLGPVLAIMPWNFPFWQVVRFAAPALMAGNSIVLKHAPNVPGCSLALQWIFAQAGFVPGLFQSIFAEPELVRHVIADNRVRGVTLTGSEAAGMSVAEQAGRALKKVVLELGGSDALIVMPSADLDEAIATAVRSRMLNNGQSCIAAKRLLLHDAIYDEGLDRLLRAIGALRVGDPMDERTDVGPLALERFAVHLEAQVERAITEGARALIGGARHALGGAYFDPTVLVDIPRCASASREEFFGPVMQVYRVRDLDDAISLANDTPFGLAASVWTSDRGEQERFATELETGQVTFSGMTISDPRVPFGGAKRSGLGRELGVYGVREFTNLKSINFPLSEAARVNPPR